MDNDDEEDEEEEEEIPLDLEEVEAVSKKARQDEEIHSEHMQVCAQWCLVYHRHHQCSSPQVLEKLKANQRRDYLKGTVSGSVQATDRLMKELRDIYRSPSFKSGAYQVCNTIFAPDWI